MGVDRLGGHHLAGAVDDGHLHARPQPGVEPHRGPGAGRGGQQQVAQVGGEDADGLVLRRLPQPGADVEAEVDGDPRLPRPPHGLAQPGLPRGRLVKPPRVARPAPVQGHTEAGGDAGLVVGRLARVDGDVEDLLLLAPEQGQDPVRRQPGERLGELEVVGELGAGLLPARPHGGDSRSGPIRSASSAKCSARMARAPSNAAVVSATPLSASTYAAATAAGSTVGSASSVSARGSRPASRAIWAFVRRFGL